MENKNEAKYYFIWLYISLLLHLLLVIIMLTIKPSSSQLTEPDPALPQIDPTQIIFMTDKSVIPVPTPDDNDEVESYELAKKTQGSTTGNSDHGSFDHVSPHETSLTDTDNDKEHEIPETVVQDKILDIATKALTDEFKKGLKDLTTIEDQPLADVTIQAKVSAAQVTDMDDTSAQTQEIVEQALQDVDEITIEKIMQLDKQSQKKSEPVEQFNLLQEIEAIPSKKQPEMAALALAKKVAEQPVTKVASKKHRPLEVGTINQSKLELNKDVAENIIPTKKKFSLQDLNMQKGFSEFVRKGNAEFSSDGNAEHDNAMGLKRASYMNQVGTMHKNAWNSYPEKYILKKDQIPVRDSIIVMVIERSGKVTLMPSQSSGVQSYDDFHMKVLQYLGDCPPIPKYIEAPFSMPSSWLAPTSDSYGYYRPGKLEL